MLVCLLSVLGGLSAPIRADASVGLGDFDVTPSIIATDPVTSEPPSAVPVPARDAVSDRVGATLAQFRVDEGGNATYSIPIQVPPGTAGMTPKLALSYNSRAAGSVMGPGWGIQGTSQIARCRQTRESGDFYNPLAPVPTPYDGNPAPVNFTTSDRYCLDGVRLLVIGGAYGANGSTYSPENDPTTRVTASVSVPAEGPDSFTVKRKDGTASTYGKIGSSDANNARITASLPSNQTVAVSWNLARVQDTKGNYYDYIYQKNPSGAMFPFSAVEFVLKQVKYTGHAVAPVSAPYATVEFFYGNVEASGVRLGYQAGITFLQTQRLDHVTVVDASHATSPMLRYYKLEYQTSASGSGFKQLQKITECRDDSMAVCFPATTFGLSAASYAFSDSGTQSQSSPDFTSLVGYKLADVDGDGRLDLVWAKDGDSHCGAGLSALYVSYGDRAGDGRLTLATPAQTPTCAAIDVLGNDAAWHLVDYNGDGRADLLVGGGPGSHWAIRPGGSRPATGTARAFGSNDLLGGLAQPIVVPGIGNWAAAAGIVADINGDGLPDFLYGNNQTGTAIGIRLLQMQGGTPGFSSAYTLNLNFSDARCNPAAVQYCAVNFFAVRSTANAIDIDGDGRADLSLMVTPVPLGSQLANANPDVHGIVFDPSLGSSAPGPLVSMGDDRRTATTYPVFLYQFTSAGARNFCTPTTSCFDFNQYWSAATGTASGSMPSENSKVWVADLNGDGLADILYQDAAVTTTYWAMINSGAGYRPPFSVAGIAASSAVPPVQLADINGDGRLDLVYYPTSTTASYVTVVPASGGFAFSSPASVPGGGVHASAGWIGLLADFDGDGATDFVSVNVAGSSNNLYASRSAGTPTSCTAISNSASCSRHHARDVVTSFTNGLGATTTVAYQPLTNHGVYEAGRGAPRTVTTMGYGSPVFDVLAPLYVVSQAQSSTPLQGAPAATGTIFYRYAGSRIQTGGRGSLGFWATWTFEENDRSAVGNQYVVSLNGYSQDYPFIGMPEATYKLVFGGTLTRGSSSLDNCAVKGPEYVAGCFAAVGDPRWPDLFASGIELAETGVQPFCNGAGCTALPSDYATACTTAASTNALMSDDPITGSLFTPPAVPGPIFAYDLRVTDSRFDLGGATGLGAGDLTTQTETVSCYDGDASTRSHGNLANSRIVTHGPEGLVAQKLIGNTYADDTSNWFLGRLTQSQIQFRRGTQTVTRRTSYTYDPASGLLLSERTVPETGQAAAQDLTTVYAPDAYGNRKSVHQCSSDVASCQTTTFPQRSTGTTVHRYAGTTFDSVGRYATASTLPFYDGSTNPTIQIALNVSARDEFGNATGQSGINGLVQTDLYGTLGRPYFKRDNTGKATTTTYRLCGTGAGRVGCSSDGMLVFREQTVSAGAPTVWTYYDVLGRAVLTVTQGYDDNPAGQQFVAACSYRDRHDRVVYQSEPFFLNVAADAGDGSPTLTSPPCAGASTATTTAYDVLGRPATVTHPDATQTIKGYVGLTTFTTDQRGFVWEESRNAMGEVVETRDPAASSVAPSGLIVRTTYDPAGNVATVTRDAINNESPQPSTKIVTQFGYDAWGRKTSQTDPDSGTTTFGYNAAGDVVSQTDAKNQTVAQSYDAMGRRWQRTLTNAADANAIQDTWTYDRASHGYGQLSQEARSATAATATNFTRTYTYDGFGRPGPKATTIGAAAYSESIAYDAKGRPWKQQDASGYYVTTAYTAKGYLHDLTDSRAGTLYQVFAMNARGQATSEQRGGSVSMNTALTYDAATGRLTDLCSGANCALQKLHYAYDNNGSLTSRSRAYNSAQQTTEEFVNDEMNRLTQAKLTRVNGVVQTTPIVTASLSYDKLGNLCAKDGAIYKYAARSGCTNLGTGGGPHAVRQAGTSSYDYDADGNQTGSNLGRTLAYNGLNQLAKASATTGSASTTFEYAPGGERFLRKDTANPSGTLCSTQRPASDRIFCDNFDRSSGAAVATAYVGNVEIIGSGATALKRRYLGGIAIDTVSTGGSSTRYLFADHLGSIDVIANASGALVEALSFDVHGNRRNPTSWQGSAPPAGSTTHGYTGHEHVDGFGFIHMNGRIYDPKLGRMLQTDPLADGSGQGWNRYSYVVNNPLALTDPTGYFSWGGFLRTVAAIAIAYVTYGAATTLWSAGTYASYAWAIGTVAAGGYAAGVVQTGTFEGGVAGAGSAVLFFGIGQYFDSAGWAHDGGSIGATQLNEIGFSMKILAHGVAGGVMSSLQGGKFGNGFASAGVTEAAGPWIDGIGRENGVGQSLSAQRIVAAAVVGGTTSVIAGGKFGNGALTGAFSRAFNDEMSARSGSKVPLSGGVIGRMAGDGYGPPAPYDSINEAASAGLTAAHSIGNVYEYGGAVIGSGNGGYYATPPVTINDRYNFGFSLPPGEVPVAIYHTHPITPTSDYFSQNDVKTATRLGVVSYIGVYAKDSIRYFDPNTMGAITIRNFGGGTSMQGTAHGELLCKDCFH